MYRRIAMLVCVGAALAAAASASEPVKFKPRMLAVFKNGLGFFVRTAEAKLADGWAVTDFVPQATLGTFWMSTPATGSYVEEIVAFQEQVDRARDSRTIDELLRANIGKRVRIARTGFPDLEGEVKSVAEGGGENVVQIAMLGRTVVFPRSQIASLELLGEFDGKTTDKIQEKRIRFKLKNAPASATVTMAYLSKGITWTPGYLIDIEDAKKARITFKSTLSDDIEDLEGVDVFFVVGYPNFAFSDSVSPMALQQSVIDLVRGAVVGAPARADYLSNFATQSMQYGGYGGYAGRPAPSVSDYATVGTPGQHEADLFLYSKPGVTIKKGERAEYTIFTASVDYEHIYEWTVDDVSGVDPFGYRVQGDREVKPKDAVWHSLRLTNATDYPWTTAPALVVSGNKPLAQDQLDYTSKSAKGTLKMTVATDIAIDKSEDEVERKHNVELNNSRYDEVTVRGELTLTNYNSEPAKLSVKKNLTGEVTSTSPEGSVVKTAQGLAGVNPKSVVTWEFTLGAGESTKLTYQGRVYVRS